MFVDKIILGNSVENYIIAISILVLFLGVGQLFSKILIKIIKKIASKTKTMLDDILVNILEKPTVFAITILGLYISSSMLDFGERGYQVLHNVFTILIVWNIIWIINKIIDALVEHYMAPLTNKSKSQLDNHLLPFVRKFLKIVVVILGILFILRNIGYDVTSLIAGLGIGGLAFALAAQPLLSNLFGGVAIIADKPFQIGDRVRIDQKFEGYVKEIGMRSTVIKTPIDTLIHIPNNIIATTTVENLSTTADHGVIFTF
ncbi:MAG: mechanosensitive ion channel family protein, partial [Candidatus Woesearchaeota archaeon]